MSGAKCFEGLFDKVSTVDPEQIIMTITPQIHSIIKGTPPPECTVTLLYDSFIHSPIKPLDRSEFCRNYRVPLAGLAVPTSAANFHRMNTPESLAIVDALIISKRIQMTGYRPDFNIIIPFITPFVARGIFLHGGERWESVKAELLAYQGGFQARYDAQELVISNALIAFVGTLKVAVAPNRASNGSRNLAKWIPELITFYKGDKEAVFDNLVELLKPGEEESKALMKAVYAGGARKRRTQKRKSSRHRRSNM